MQQNLRFFCRIQMPGRTHEFSSIFKDRTCADSSARRKRVVKAPHFAAVRYEDRRKAPSPSKYGSLEQNIPDASPIDPAHDEDRCRARLRTPCKDWLRNYVRPEQLVIGGEQREDAVQAFLRFQPQIGAVRFVVSLGADGDG